MLLSKLKIWKLLPIVLPQFNNGESIHIGEESFRTCRWDGTDHLALRANETIAWSEHCLIEGKKCQYFANEDINRLKDLLWCSWGRECDDMWGISVYDSLRHRTLDTHSTLTNPRSAPPRSLKPLWYRAENWFLIQKETVKINIDCLVQMERLEYSIYLSIHAMTVDFFKMMHKSNRCKMLVKVTTRNCNEKQRSSEGNEVKRVTLH